MKKYLAIARASLQEYLAYRLNLFLEIFGVFLTQVVIIILWYAIYQGAGTQKIGNFTLPEMITYLIGAGIIHSIILLTSQGNEIEDDIHLGDLANLLVKPISVPTYWLVRDICRRVLTFVLGIGEYLMLLIIFADKLVLPESPLYLFLTLVAISVAGLLHFYLFYIFSLISFWMEQAWGPRFVIRVVMEIACGAIIPLSLFPHFWQKLFDFLPFKYLAYVPLTIYLGKMALPEALTELLIGVIWIGLMVIAANFLWERGLKKYSAYGH